MTDKTYLSRADILATEDLATEDVWVPEWKTWVRVRSLRGIDRDRYQALLVKSQADVTANIRGWLVATSVIDAKGERVFTDADAGPLGEKNATALERIVDVVLRLNALRAEDVEALAGNSEPSPSGASTSG